MNAHACQTLAIASSLQITVTACVSALAVAIISYFALRQKPVYLIDFSVYKAPER
jgi:hypothetical protein